MRKRSPGKTLAEYGLILALLVLAAVPALAFLGDQISDGMANNANSVSQADRLFGLLGAGGGGGGGNIAIGQPPDVTGANGSPPVESEGISPESMAGSAQADTMGFAAMTTSVQGDSSDLIRNSGSAGAMKALASDIDKAIDQALASGEITPAQASALRNLANQGHTIAAAEKMIEDHIAAGKLNEPITYKGTTYQNAFYMAWKEVGFDGQPMSQYEPMEAPGAGAEMKKFQELYRDLKAQGLMDTELGQQVTWLANEIAHIGESTDDVLSLQANKVISLEAFNELMASNVTHQHSTAICTTGGVNTSTGTSCN